MPSELSQFFAKFYRLAVLSAVKHDKRMDTTTRLKIELAITNAKILMPILYEFTSKQEREKIEYHIRRVPQLTVRDLQRIANNKNLFPETR